METSKSARSGLALITGASSGIGRELALLAARHGYDLVVTGRSGALRDVAEECRRCGSDVWAVEADLAQSEGVENVWKTVMATNRPLDVAILNAGRSIGGSFLDTDLNDELDLIGLNVTSVVHLAKHVSRHMANQRQGKILITSSLSATLPTPYETVYGPSRAFVYMFAQSLRQELREHNVTVTALLPGATDTEFHHRAGMDNTAFGKGAAKNSRVEVARQGFAAMISGRDHVVGGNLKTKLVAIKHRFLPEPYKAVRHAEKARPRS